MLDLWPTEEGESGARGDEADADGKQAMNRLIEQALRRELERRRGIPAHVQLGVRVDASERTIDQAYRRLSARYRPELFIDCGPDAIVVVAEISDLLAAARRQLLEGPPPHPVGISHAKLSEETLRAFETLRGAIARRYDEAVEYREAGDVASAIRGFEAVLELDHGHEEARAALKVLRTRLRWRRPSLLARILRRLGR
jgi:hypothetical protein